MNISKEMFKKRYRDQNQIETSAMSQSVSGPTQLLDEFSPNPSTSSTHPLHSADASERANEYKLHPSERFTNDDKELSATQLSGHNSDNRFDNPRSSPPIPLTRRYSDQESSSQFRYAQDDTFAPMSRTSHSTIHPSGNHCEATPTDFARANPVSPHYLGSQENDNVRSVSPVSSRGPTLVHSPHTSLSSSTRYSELGSDRRPATGQERGQRIEIYYPRGVTWSVGSREQQDQWLHEIQIEIKYLFVNPDLLEEALESPLSGIAVVGHGRRDIPDGNTGMAALGHTLVKFILMNQCYILRMPAEKGKKQVKKLMSEKNFFNISKASRIRGYIRPPMTPKNGRVFSTEFDESCKVIAKAMKAIIAAVYLDSGESNAEAAMRQLGLYLRASS